MDKLRVYAIRCGNDWLNCEYTSNNTWKFEKTGNGSIKSPTIFYGVDQPNKLIDMAAALGYVNLEIKSLIEED